MSHTVKRFDHTVVVVGNVPVVFTWMKVVLTTESVLVVSVFHVMIEAMDWVVSIVMAFIMVHIMASSVKISILDLVMFNTMVGLSFDTVEKIIIFMLNVFHQL